MDCFNLIKWSKAATYINNLPLLFFFSTSEWEIYHFKMFVHHIHTGEYGSHRHQREFSLSSFVFSSLKQLFFYFVISEVGVTVLNGFVVHCTKNATTENMSDYRYSTGVDVCVLWHFCKG